jgi:hypothetical protein
MPSYEYLDERRLDEYLATIRKKIVDDWRDSMDCLSLAEKATITVHVLVLEISNGGFEQFFINPGGDRWRETRDALNTVGAARLGAMFDEALSVFPDAAPSTDQLTRCGQYDQAGDHAKWLMDRLTNEYNARSPEDCLYQILTAFAIKQMATE